MSELTYYGANYLAKALLMYLHGPDHPIKVRLFRSIAKRLFPHGVLLENECGTKLFVQADEYIGWSILCTGAYEKDTLALGRKLLEKGGSFLDVGANFGLFTYTLGAIPGVQTYAVEPYAKEFVKLQKNLSINSQMNVQLFNVALSNLHTLLMMEDFDPGNSGTIRVLLNDAETNSKRHTVSATTLQDLLVYAQTSEITLMKIDVEGYELPILEGLNWDSSLRPRHIIAEFTDYSARTKGDGRKSLQDYLAQKGYEGFTVHGQPLSLECSTPEDNAWFQDTNYID